MQRIPTKYSYMPSKYYRPKKKVQKPGILILANIHGNEWISNSVALWFIKSLVEGHVENGKKTTNFMFPVNLNRLTVKWEKVSVFAYSQFILNSVSDIFIS